MAKHKCFIDNHINDNVFPNSLNIFVIFEIILHIHFLEIHKNSGAESK